MSLFSGAVAFAAVSVAFSCLKAADPVEFSVGGFAFERPEGWRWVVPTSAMRRAELSLENVGTGEKAEVTFFHFGKGQGGGVDSNIARWISQFSEPIEQIAPRVEAGMAGGTRITFVRAEGTFQSGMPGGPTTPLPGFALHGAILEDPAGGDVFVKMTGPKSLVDGAATAFESMVKRAGAAGISGGRSEPTVSDQPPQTP